jgi:hypothetical protein
LHLTFCAAFRAVGRTLAGAQHLTNFFTLFLVLVLSSLPLMTWTTGNECDMLHTKMYASSPKGSKDARCAILMWDLFFASLLVGGTVRSARLPRGVGHGYHAVQQCWCEKTGAMRAMMMCCCC